MNATRTKRTWQTLDEIAAEWGVTRRTVRNWIDKGVAGVRLRSERAGVTYRVQIADFDAWRAAVDLRRGIVD